MVSVCSFEAVGRITRQTTYADLRRRALAAGRFSVFEATVTPKAAKLFTQLCQDPEIVTRAEVFPWTSVRLKDEDRG